MCDFQALTIAFFPLQAPGFLLVFLALLGMFTRYNKARGHTKTELMSVAAVPVISSNILFVIVQVLGCAGTQWCLFAMALRMKKKLAAALFAVAFVFMLCMGYMTSQFDDSSAMNWVDQCVNTVSQGALLAGVLVLHKAGLHEKEALKK